MFKIDSKMFFTNYYEEQKVPLHYVISFVDVAVLSNEFKKIKEEKTKLQSMNIGQNLNNDRSDRSDRSDRTFINTLILCIIKVLYNGINGFDSIVISYCTSLLSYMNLYEYISR